MGTDNDKYNDRLGKTLKTALRNHKLPQRADFAEKMLVKLTEQQQQKILAKVVFQERLALAGLILIPIAAVIMIFIFPDVLIGLSAWLGTRCDVLWQEALKSTQLWQLWTITLLAISAAVYSVIDMISA